MKALLFFFLWIGLVSFSKAQECRCSEVMQKALIEVETNLASYQHQVVLAKRQGIYQKHRRYILKHAGKITDKKRCTGLLALYLSFFRDEHLFVRYAQEHYTFNSRQDTAAVKAFFRSDESFALPEVKNKGYQGTWFSADGKSTIRIVPDKQDYRQLVGLIEEGDGFYWWTGQIRLEFVSLLEGETRCLVWSNSRFPKCYKVRRHGNTLEIGPYWRFYRERPVVQPAPVANESPFQFEILSEQTTCLRLPDFELKYFPLIDTLVANHLHEMTSRPNLIIDLRNNGGGGDRSFQALLPFVSDKLLVPEPYSASVWVSDSNLAYYERTLFDFAETRADSLAEIRYIDWLKEYRGKFTPPDTGSSWLDTLYARPLRVAIITNNGCASSTEGFLVIARESAKVIHYGTPTLGAISYGDWRKVDVPELEAWFSLTTKRMVFINDQDFESIGLIPHKMLDPEQEADWIRQVMENLESR